MSFSPTELERLEMVLTGSEPCFQSDSPFERYRYYEAVFDIPMETQGSMALWYYLKQNEDSWETRKALLGEWSVTMPVDDEAMFEKIIAEWIKFRDEYIMWRRKVYEALCKSGPNRPRRNSS